MRKLGFACLALLASSCMPGAGAPGAGSNDGQAPSVRVPIVPDGGNDTVNECNGITRIGVCSNDKKRATRCDTDGRRLIQETCDADETCDVANGAKAECRKTNDGDAAIGNPVNSDGSCTHKAVAGYCKTENGVSTAYY